MEQEDCTLDCNTVEDWQLGLRPPEPFDPSPLQRHGDRLAGPVAYALRRGEPGFAPPDWPPGRDALRRFSGTLSGALFRAVQERLLRARQLPDWRRARQAMACVFGFRDVHHFFHAAPLGWVTRVWLTEPQVTKAIAHFLHSEDRVTRGGRIRALLTALGGHPEGTEGGLGIARATAEAPVAGTRQRIDLLIEWQDGEGFDRAAAIEAKFGHGVTAGQLPAYRRHLLRVERQYRRAEHVGEPESPLLFVVSSGYRKSDDRALARNRDWRWKSWRALLLAYDRFLEPQHDDETFRQFRRTLWDRAG